jgi:predicted nucleic acid-binding protein
MSELRFIDTNILLYSISHDPPKHANTTLPPHCSM